MGIQRAALYIRVSSEQQRENDSPETEEAACRTFCAAKGYALDEAHVYHEVHTATDPARHVRAPAGTP